MRLAVFDCDGTLVDGQADICEAMELAFARCALPAPDRHLIRRAVGLSLPRAMMLLAPATDAQMHDALAEAYKQAFRTARSEGRLAEPLFPGIDDLVRRLNTAGWMLGVATGKSDRGLTHCLAVHNLSDAFATLQTADRHPSKPHPAMLEAALAETGVDAHNAVMIGDTVFDIEMARHAGVRAIGVSWGYHEVEELLEAGADIVAESPDELEEILR
ncbi:MAG: HAD-IA family hydrolase [Novosphingobium sp.]